LNARTRLALVLGVATLATHYSSGAPRDDASGGDASAPASAEPVRLSKEELVARYPEIDPREVRDGPIPGLYEVVIRNRVSYVTTDGRFLIRGDVVELPTQRNLTDRRRAEYRAHLLSAIDPTTEIVFSPKSGPVKHRVIVFTDVDCAYCRQLHRDIAEFNALGIEVRYVAYPRTGPNTPSWTKAESVWCAADRNEALTAAKRGAEVPAVAGCVSPVAAEYQLGRRIGLSGTPGVYSESGVELGGYVPPAELFAALEKVDNHN